MLIDSTGLGYTIRRGEILVHYPTRAAKEGQQDDAASGTAHHYGVGWPIGPIPSWYAESPPNAITAERVKLWAQLQPAEDSAEE
jgi:hypothetical protein